MTLFAIVAVVAAMTSCNKEKLDDPSALAVKGVERNINATAILQQPADKAFIDGFKVKWNSGDQINVNGEMLTATSANGQVAEFGGPAHAISSGGNEVYWAVYPTTLAGIYTSGIPAEFTTNALTVTFPTTQTYNSANSALQGNTFMAAYASVASGTTDVPFRMHNLGSVMKLTLQPKAGNASNRVDSLVFTSSNGYLAGAFSVSNDPTNPTVAPSAGTSKLVVKFLDGGNRYIDITGGITVYVMFPPLASKNLNVKIYGTAARYTEMKITSATLARNTFYTSTISNIAFEKPEPQPFSVSATKKVLFSPGNLQWSATGGGTTATTHAVAGGGTAEGTWRFAEHPILDRLTCP